jgi:hypothetical protein
MVKQLFLIFPIFNPQNRTLLNTVRFPFLSSLTWRGCLYPASQAHGKAEIQKDG